MAGLDQLEPVSADILTQWKVAKKHGDITAIADYAQATKIDVQNAFKGFAYPNLIKQINRYYGIKK